MSGLREKDEDGFSGNEEESMIHGAAYNDEIDTLMEIYQRRPLDIFLQSKSGNNCLHIAAASNSHRVLQFLIELQDYSLLNSCNKWDETALHLATAASNVEALVKLLNAGANPMLTDKWNRTPKMVALQYGSSPCLEVLRNYDASPETIQLDPIELRSNVQFQQITKEFLEVRKSRIAAVRQAEVVEQHIFSSTTGPIASDTPVLPALSKFIEYPGDPNYLRQLLDEGKVNPAGKDMLGYTALHKFSSWDKVDLIEILSPYLLDDQFTLPAGGKMDRNRFTCLHLCVEMRSWRALTYLTSPEMVARHHINLQCTGESCVIYTAEYFSPVLLQESCCCSSFLSSLTPPPTLSLSSPTLLTSMDISPLIFSIPDYSVHNIWCLLLTLVGPEFFGASDAERFTLEVSSRAPWKDLASVIWEWDLTKSLNFGKIPTSDHPGNAIFRRLSKYKQSNAFDTRQGNWCKAPAEHEMIKMFLKVSYPIKAFDKRLRKFLIWFRQQRYMAPALWEEICWGLRMIIHHNLLSQVDTRNYPIDMSYPILSFPLSESEDDEEDAEDPVTQTLFESVDRFKKYLFFLIQGSDGPITNDEISNICKRETGLYPKQHMIHLSIQESLTGFICKHLSDRVESTTDEKIISHSLRPIPLPTCPNLPPTNILKKDTSTSSQISDHSRHSVPVSSHLESESTQTIKFASLEEYADYIYSVIEKSHPVRNDVISAACRADTGVYPRHHFREHGYDAFLTKFIRTYLGTRVNSRKLDNGEWVHEILTSKGASSNPSINVDFSDTDDSDGEPSHLIVEPPDDHPRIAENEEGLQNFKNYLYNVIRSFAGPITFSEINAQCLNDLDTAAATLLVKLGYTDKFMIFIRTYLAGFVLCYHRESQAYYIATPKIFLGYTPMKLIKTYPLTTLSLFAEFVFSQVVALGGLNSPVSYHALDTRCAEVIGVTLQQQLTTLEWRSAPNKFLAAYPSGRLVVVILDGVTCIRVKPSQASQVTGSRLFDQRSPTQPETQPTGRVVTNK